MIRGYDQWKTASPYDDEPDPFEDAEEFIRQHKNGDLPDAAVPNSAWAVEIIDHLLGIMWENGVIDEDLYNRITGNE